MSNIDFTKLRKAADIAAERAKADAVRAEKDALRAEINAGLPDSSLPAIIARIDAIERLLGLKPLQAEAGE